MARGLVGGAGDALSVSRQAQRAWEAGRLTHTKQHCPIRCALLPAALAAAALSSTNSSFDWELQSLASALPHASSADDVTLALDSP